MEVLYKLEHFEGPLDLLLHLIEKDKINIYDIPIFDITEQYFAYIQKMEEEDLDFTSDFLVMAATLIEIKSRMLLPKVVDESTGVEIDPREDLVKRLLEHKKFKKLAQELSGLEVMAERHLYKEPTIPKEVLQYEPEPDLDILLADVSLKKLKEIFDQAIRRNAMSIDPERSKFGTIKKEPINLEERIGKVLDYIRETRRCSFAQFLKNQKNRQEIVVTFLAILELMKVGKIWIEQEENFGEIFVEATDSIDDIVEDRI